MRAFELVRQPFQATDKGQFGNFDGHDVVSDNVRRKPDELGASVGGSNTKRPIEFEWKSEGCDAPDVVPFTSKLEKALLINWLTGLFSGGLGNWVHSSS